MNYISCINPFRHREMLLEKMGSSETESNAAANRKEDADEQPLTRRLSEAQQKMATLPTSSVLRYLSEESAEWPVLQVKNVFILPGVPQFFNKKIQQVAAYLPKRTTSADLDEDIGLSVDQSAQSEASQSSPTLLSRSDTYRIVLSLPEENIVTALNAAVEAHPHVSFGSYPIVNSELKTIITLEGKFYKGSAHQIQSMFFSKEDMDKNVELALNDIKSRLPEEGIVFIDTYDDLRIN